VTGRSTATTGVSPIAGRPTGNLGLQLLPGGHAFIRAYPRLGFLLASPETCNRSNRDYPVGVLKLITYPIGAD
jgi:hypothetical protein